MQYSNPYFFIRVTQHLLLLLLLLLLALGLLLLLLLLLLLVTGAGVGGGGLLVLGATALHDGLLELVGGAGDVVLAGVGAVHGGAELLEQGADVLLLGVADVLPVVELLLGSVDLGLGVVLDLNDLALEAIGLGVGLGVADHLLDVGLGETTVGGDGDVLLLAGSLVLGHDGADTVGVDVEGDLNLGNTAGSRGDADQVEVAHELVVGGHLALALEDLDANLGLVVSGGGVHLGLLGGDGGVLGDHAGEDATEGLDTEGEGG
eukprot:492796_1